MRLIDVLQQTQAHCSLLTESRPNNGRTVSDVAAMARYGFVRQDFASWFEDRFGKNIQDHVGAVAGLLIAFGLGVHTRFAYKNLFLSPALYPILQDWVDPVVHSASAFQRVKLTDADPIDIDRHLPDDLALAFPANPAVWSFFAAYIENSIDAEIVEIAMERVAKTTCTSLIISQVPMRTQQLAFEAQLGKPMSFSGNLESLGLYIYYQSR
jgi:hypothetical protein